MAKSIKFKWSSEAENTLVENLERYPCLYNTKLEGYKDGNKRLQAGNDLVPLFAVGLRTWQHPFAFTGCPGFLHKVLQLVAGFCNRISLEVAFFLRVNSTTTLHQVAGFCNLQLVTSVN